MTTRLTISSCGECPLTYDGYCTHPERGKTMTGNCIDEWEKVGTPEWCPLIGNDMIVMHAKTKHCSCGVGLCGEEDQDCEIHAHCPKCGKHTGWTGGELCDECDPR
jgi:hypothetical protein